MRSWFHGRRNNADKDDDDNDENDVRRSLPAS